MGFRYVASGPLVRSSYRAGEFFVEAMIKGDRGSAAARAAAASTAQQGGTHGLAVGGTAELGGVAVAVPELE